MKFGIFYELQLPRPWQAGGELKLYQDALTQLETADRCGYDHAWVVEHHFLEEYSHSPSPESFLAAASQRRLLARCARGRGCRADREARQLACPPVRQLTRRRDQYQGRCPAARPGPLAHADLAGAA